MRLAFDDHGPGPVVVLLHGFPFDRTMWSFQRARLGSMYRVITPDLRGHGETPAPYGTYSIDEMADDVIELLDDLQLTEPVVVGGLSMGGYVALSLALRYPERVLKLILLNTRASADSPTAASARQEKAREIEASGKVDDYVDSMVPKLFASSTFENQPRIVAKLREGMLKTTPRAIVGTLRGLATRPDRTEALTSIKIPTLVVAGVSDQIVPMAETEAMAAMISQATLVTIPDAGHVAPLENPEATDLALLEFLERTD